MAEEDRILNEIEIVCQEASHEYIDQHNGQGSNEEFFRSSEEIM